MSLPGVIDVINTAASLGSTKGSVPCRQRWHTRNLLDMLVMPLPPRWRGERVDHDKFLLQR